MRKSILSLLLGAVMAVGVSSAHAEVPYMDVLGPTTAPIGYVQLCQREPSFCVPRNEAPSVVQLTEPSWRDLLAINTYVNQAVAPMTDEDLYGVPEVWTMPANYGDCEDYVIMKRSKLLERGWPASALLITVVREQSGSGHAVLTVRTDRGDFVLDNQEANVFRWDETSYHYIKRQSEFDETIWSTINDARS